MKKQILLIDSLGALISAIALLIIPNFEGQFGISKNLTFILLPLPLLFSAFSFLSYKLGKQKWKLLLKIIAIANLFYCCLTLIVTMTNFATLTRLGITYFIVEIFIIVILANIELRIATSRNE